jgi:acyl-CoA dehydrogenase
MSELTHIIEQTANGIFGDNVTHKILEDFEQGGFDKALWQTIEEAGLTKVLLAEDQGGAGGSWLDAEVVLRASGRHRVPAPVGEAVAAYWLLAEAGMDIPRSGVLTWAPVLEDGEDLILTKAPWAHVADHVLLWSDKGSFYLYGKTDGLTPSKNMGAEPRSTGSLAKADAVVTALAPASLEGVDPKSIGALVRAVQMSGALDGALHISVNYATERIQFGRPIAKFQAIQQQLALMGGHVATAVRAAGAGCEALARDPATASFDIAAAKVRNGEAIEISTSVAHQVHAAIGITFEYGLNFYTRRLWSWRDEFGSESLWAEEIGRAVVELGAKNLWDAVTAGSLEL